MKYRYDLHIHSALSPCAEEEMTPVTIVGQAALSGLDFVAIADHNAIGHVPLALRAGEEFGVNVVPAVEVQTNKQFKVEATGGLLDYKPTVLSYGFFESFPAGITLGVNTLNGYVSDMKYVFTKEGAKSVGGFGTIGSIFPKVWDWERFWSMTAFLSIIAQMVGMFLLFGLLIWANFNDVLRFLF